MCGVAPPKAEKCAQSLASTTTASSAFVLFVVFIRCALALPAFDGFQHDCRYRSSLRHHRKALNFVITPQVSMFLEDEVLAVMLFANRCLTQQFAEQSVLPLAFAIVFIYGTRPLAPAKATRKCIGLWPITLFTHKRQKT
jgi:hypothetical protein